MAARKINFNPGPAALPLPVLEKLAASTIETGGAGMSIYEMSHRSKDFEKILVDAKQRMRELFGIPDDYHILFLGGGASLQFCMAPMNFLQGGSADYVRTGEWAKKAAEEAKRFGTVRFAGDTKADNFNHLPDKLDFDPSAKYVHFTTNNTIFGTQYRDFPSTGAVPLFADMSSDMMSHRWDVKKFSFIYGGAQKNMGVAGLTFVILKNALLERAATDVPTMLSYQTHVEKDSLFNTPPVGPIYITKLLLDWMAEIGGLEVIEQRNRKKAELLYGAIDQHADYYQGTVVNKEHRSWMNVCFRLPSPELEDKFIKEGTAQGLHGMKGHRSVGGVRISMYNAISPEEIQKLVDYMVKFRQTN
ncbi:MAG: 3-phosphoserine/phosphohydroxythreonine transaminase [Deltaproteobacteria bacterium]|nr:3-phosphoserine/phosphohydroxythreonine transaminase [Deltaproteobacteria bacterium]